MYEETGGTPPSTYIFKGGVSETDQDKYLEHALYELYTLVVDNTIAPWLVKTFWPFGIKYRSSLDVQLIMVSDSFFVY